MIQIRPLIRSALFYFESRISSWIASKIGWLYWPLYWLLKKYNVCFVINIAGGTGHIICELDQFTRLLLLKKIDPNKRYVWIRKSDMFSSICVKYYKKYFWLAKANYLLYELLLPLTMRYKEITLDCGLSGLQWQLDNLGRYIRPISGQNYINLLPHSQLVPLWNRYYQLRSESQNDYPLIIEDLKWGKLKDLIGDRTQKRVLIHIKEKKGNATAAETDPTTYLETLQYLYEKKKQLVFVGREKVPSCFRDFSVIPYSESPLAHFEHDIALFQSCETAIIGGSGISFLADCYNKPYLYINSWHIAQPIYYPFSIVVPTLLEKENGELAPFEEQIALFLTTQPDGRVENLHRYKARNASSDEILAAFHELEQLVATKAPETPLQQTMRQLGKNLPLEYSASRVSDPFLNKHRDLFTSRNER